MLEPRPVMDASAAFSAKPVMYSGLVKTRDKAPLSQVLTLKAFSMQRIFDMVQNAVQKSCTMASRIMCIPVQCPVCCSAQPQQRTRAQIEQEALRGPRSTVLIVNISNSTLKDCIIGDKAYQGAVTEQQPLMRPPESLVHGQQTCSCSHGQQGAEQVSSDAEQLSISIKSSHLNCVIIGDYNEMHVEQGQPFE